MRLLQVIDTTSGRSTTIKVFKISYPDNSTDIIVHQIEGAYDNPQDFDREWNALPSKQGLVNFLSLGLLDARRLVNALIEEIRGEESPLEW